MISCPRDSCSSQKDIGIWLPEYYYHFLKLVTVEFSVYLHMHIKMDKSVIDMYLLAYAYAKRA